MLRFLLRQAGTALLPGGALMTGLLIAGPLIMGPLIMGLAGCHSAPAKAPEPPPPAAPKPAPSQQPPVLSQAPSPPILLQAVGFLSPQAAVHDPEADVYLVSNSNGGPADADGNGFISRVSPEGTLLALKWIDGAAGAALDAPKGMALSEDKLYVADINVVRSFDRKSGEPLGKVAIMSARYLDDLAFAPDGTLYVSDTGLAKPKKGKGTELQKSGADAIYAVDARGGSRLFVKGPELGQPTGLLADATGLWVANLSGELFRVSAEGKRFPGARLPGAGLQGLVETETGSLVLACSETSTVYLGKRRVVPGGVGAGAESDAPAVPAPPAAFDPLITEISSPGRIGYDRKRRQLLVPLLKDDSLYIQQIPAG
jgi:hypothetical protein